MLIFKLSEIAKWGECDSRIIIPPLQRGLVWKANQVEMLWDSILRGFPIGSFMLSDASDNKYYLLDGQQRFNAISLGFIHDHEASSVLWIDIRPDFPTGSTRKFLVKATTSSHPWGYNNDDASSRLNTAEKRQAIMNFGLNGTIYNTCFSLEKTWPVKARKPIPLYCFTNASLDNEEFFLSSVIENFAKTDFANKRDILDCLTEEDKAYIKSLYKVFEKLTKFEITCNHLTKEVLESEIDATSDDTDNASTLEILFTRLNTGGTTISRDDLLYSSIKSYWPEIKDVIDRVSKTYMEPAKLVNLVFRLILTEEERGFAKSPSLKRIRSIARKEPDIAAYIINFCNTELCDVLSLIDNWLNVGHFEGSTPTVLRTSIINRSEDVYLLLMYLAKGHLDFKCLFDSKHIRALAFALHWFAYDQRRVVDKFVSLISTHGWRQDSLELAFSECFYQEWVRPVFSPEEIKRHIVINANPRWTPSGNHPVVDFFRFISGNKELLLYAQRNYLNSHFPNYDPSRRDLWEDYNRPWDFDHIIPQNWILGKRSEYRDYCKYWLNNIGNFAAISFDINRSKSDRNDYTEYQHNRDSLLFNEEVTSLTHLVTFEKTQSEKFAKITFERLCNIYSKVFEEIGLLYHPKQLPIAVRERKQFIESFIANNPAFQIWEYSMGEYYVLERENDWNQHWLAIGQLKSNVFLTVELDAESECWIGIRRVPGKKIDIYLKNLLISTKGNKFTDYDFGEDMNYYCYKRTNFESFKMLSVSDEISRLYRLITEAIPPET